MIKAFSPAHITGFFYIDDTNIKNEFAGSLGAGFCIDKGITTKIALKKDYSEFYINGKKTVDAKVSKTCIEIFQKEANVNSDNFCVKHKIDVPLGCGFGTSGGGALSLSYALNKFYNNILSKTEIGKVAHLTDYYCKTGLGTVNGEFLGGFEIRLKAGAPGYGECVKFLPDKKVYPVFVVFGKLSTEKSLAEPATRQRINSIGKEAVNSFFKNQTVDNFVLLSSNFTDEVKIATKEVANYRAYLKSLGLDSAMLMFGNGIWSFAKSKNDADKIVKLLKKKSKCDNINYHPKIFHSNISLDGGGLL